MKKKNYSRVADEASNDTLCFLRYFHVVRKLQGLLEVLDVSFLVAKVEQQQELEETHNHIALGY